VTLRAEAIAELADDGIPSGIPAAAKVVSSIVENEAAAAVSKPK
jgi:hypothetical protein